jgi:hypothetical protein
VNILRCTPAVPLLAALFIPAACLLAPAAHPGSPPRAAARPQRRDCAAAVRRYQNAVTIETYSFLRAGKMVCDQGVLRRRGADSGKIKAMVEASLKSQADALRETAAAYEAAEGCDLSSVRRPKVVQRPGSAAAYAAAYTSCVGLGPLGNIPTPDAGVINSLAVGLFTGPACERSLRDAECSEFELSEEDRRLLAQAMGAQDADPGGGAPADLRPECRQAYLASRAAEEDLAQANRRAAELGRTVDPNTGARGRVMLDAAVRNQGLAERKAAAARRELEGCQASHQNLERANQSIQVVSGTYGANCGQGESNKTEHLAAACNGKPQCSYEINYRVIGDPAPGCAKNYIAKWRCGSDPRVRSAEVRPEAGRGSTVVLSCGQ